MKIIYDQCDLKAVNDYIKFICTTESPCLKCSGKVGSCCCPAKKNYSKKFAKIRSNIDENILLNKNFELYAVTSVELFEITKTISELNQDKEILEKRLTELKEALPL